MFDQIWHYKLFEVGPNQAVDVSQVTLVRQGDAGKGREDAVVE